MEMESVGVPVFEQPNYNVIRPINDLWLWWVLASVVSYLIGRILPTKLFGTSPLVSLIELPISVTISTIPVIWVLHRYLLHFNWKQWIVVNIVGLLIALVALIVVALVDFIYLGLLFMGVSISTHQPPVTNAITPMIRDVLVYATVGPIFALILSLAQWRVLKRYAREHGLGLWVSANIVSFLIGVPLLIAVKDAISNDYIITLFGIVIIAMTHFIVGYALMQILRPYAPATT
jgi:hypothetical protein